MASNFKQEGDVLTLTAPSGGVVAGTGYVFGSLFVIALVSADEGKSFAAATEGVFTMTKNTGSSGKAFTVGESVFWNDTDKKWDKTNAAYYAGAGIAVAASGTTSAACTIKITGTTTGVVGS